MIYAKSIKRKKLKYFFKYKINTILTIISKKSESKEKREIISNGEKVYDRLFNYSIIKERLLYNLSNKYLIEEEDKYPFFPKINSMESNFYIKNQLLNEIPHTDAQYYTERNFFKAKYANKLINLKNSIKNNTNNNIKKKYIPINKYKNNSKYKTSQSSFFSSNNYDSDMNNRTFNQKHIYKNENRAKINEIIPISNKNKNKNFLNNKCLFFMREKKENGENYDFSNNNKNLNSIRVINKSSPCIYNPSNRILKRNKSYNNSNLMNRVTIPTNNFTISRNSDFLNYSKNKMKIEKYKYSKEIVIPKRNGQNIEHEKKLVHSNNSSMSLYNISSIGGSLLKESAKLKPRQSPNKKEHLFSFGSDLFYVDSINPNSLRVKSSNMKKNLIKRNNTLKRGRSVRSQKHQVSTKSSGTNTYSNYNNYNFNDNKEKNKNGIEKNNKLEIQGISGYSIINDSNLLGNDILNFQTTLQTLTDSKLLDLANNYISEDDSLELYKRNTGNFNKSQFKEKID